MDDWSALATLFVTSFLSATLLPGGSEANLVYLLTQQQFADGVIVAIATVGFRIISRTNAGIVVRTWDYNVMVMRLYY